jgi:hypothetical protein
MVSLEASSQLLLSIESMGYTGKEDETTLLLNNLARVD